MKHTPSQEEKRAILDAVCTPLEKEAPVRSGEIWHCSHTRKCGWKGRFEELLEVPAMAISGLRATKGVCPKCGNGVFYVRTAKP